MRVKKFLDVNKQPRDVKFLENFQYMLQDFQKKIKNKDLLNNQTNIKYFERKNASI